MTLEEYKKKYPEHFFVNDHCFVIEKSSKEAAEMLGNNNPLWTTVFEIDVHEDTLRFGRLEFTEEFIRDVLSLKEYRIEQYKKGQKMFKSSYARQKLGEEIVKTEASIQWRKEEIKKLREEIEDQKMRIQLEKNELKDLNHQYEDLSNGIENR